MIAVAVIKDDTAEVEIVNEYEVRGVPVVDVKVDYYKYCGVPDGEYHLLRTTSSPGVIFVILQLFSN